MIYQKLKMFRYWGVIESRLGVSKSARPQVIIIRYMYLSQFITDILYDELGAYYGRHPTLASRSSLWCYFW